MILGMIALATVTLGGVGWYLLAERAVSRERSKRFAERDDIDTATFYERFYANSGLEKDRVLGILRDVAGELGIPAGKLRPADRFAHELRAPRGWEYDDGVGILGWRLTRAATKRGSPVDLREVQSLDDYIRIMASRPT